jgi:iron complex outermembrane receptor protein
MTGSIKKHLATATGLVMIAGSQQLLAQPDQVEQVLVTARKRSEPATDVAMSLSVIDSATIDAFHVRNLSDLAPLVHNVAMFEDFPGAGIPTWIIRGVGLQDFNSNNTPAAAVYADGIYQVATVMGDMALFDVGQAEILKGPQGGLYGRNTTGGAVLLNSRRADPAHQESSLSLTYGRWQQSQLDGMINLPFSDSAAWRGAARVEDGGDWQRSLATGDEHGAKQRWDLRSWLHFNPAASWSVDWKLQGGSDKSDITLGRSVGLYDPKAAVPGTFCAAVLAGHRDDKTCTNWAGVSLIYAGKPQLVEDLTKQAADGSVVWSGPLNRQSNNNVSTLLEAVWQGPLFSFKSLTAYDQYNYGVALDLDGSTGEYGHRLSSSDIGVFSQELQLLSPSNQDLTWLAGFVFTNENFSEQRDFNLRDNLLVGLGQGKLSYRQATHSQAVYADMGYQLNSNWRINANLRYTREDKHYRDGNFYTPSPPPYYFVRDLAADYQLDQHLSGSVALEYRPDTDTLLYAKVSRGFKSGGFYGGFPFYTIEVKPYQAETELAYEAGVKQSLPAWHLQWNASVFTYDYRNVQGFVRDINPITNTGIDRLENQADARHNGVELEMEWHPDSRWRLHAMLGWLDAYLENARMKTTNVAYQQVLMQGQRPYAPRWSGGLEALYQQTLSQNGSLQWALGYQVVSDYSGYQSSPVDAAVNHLPGYGRFDASVSYTQVQSPWQLQLWSKNITNKVYRTRVKDDGLNSYIEFFGEPRSVGITASLHF